MATPQDIVQFWLEEVGPGGWYARDDVLDARIRDQFLDDWERVRAGSGYCQLVCADSALGFIILTDQFPRNMFRDDPRAFATDDAARAAAKRAIDLGWDTRVAEPARQFFYLPLMHSENLPDQARCVRLVAERMPQTGAETLRHAAAHREIIRRFGRFPYRNVVLGRRSTAAEEAFVAAGGYRTVLEETAAAPAG